MKILFYAVWGILLMAFQPTLVQKIAVFDVAPNTFLIFVVIAGYLRGRKEGAAAGLIFGLLYDMLIGKMMGVNALLYMYIGFGAGILSEKFFGSGNVWMIAATVSVATLISGMIYLAVLKMVYGSPSFYTGFVKVIPPEILYNGIVSVLMYFPVRAMSRKIKKRMIY